MQDGWTRISEPNEPGPSAKSLGKRPARAPSPPSHSATLDALDEGSDEEPVASFPPGEEAREEERRIQETLRRWGAEDRQRRALQRRSVDAGPSLVGTLTRRLSRVGTGRTSNSARSSSTLDSVTESTADMLALSPVEAPDRETQLADAAARAVRHGSRFAEDLVSQIPPDPSRMRTDSDATIRRAPSMEGGPFADPSRYGSTRSLVGVDPREDDEDGADEFAGRAHEPWYRPILRASAAHRDHADDCAGTLCCAGSRETVDDDRFGQAGQTNPM